jgi:hypothetical protein
MAASNSLKDRVIAAILLTGAPGVYVGYVGDPRVVGLRVSKAF